MYTKRRLQMWFALVALGSLAWGCGNDTPKELVPGQTEFVSDDPNSNNGQGLGYDDRAAGGAESAGAPTADNKAAAPAPQGRTGEVEEADIYRVDKNRLFYLNTYRGFIIYDLNDPKKPAQISRLPVYGYPVEMFVSGTTVYALLRDALYLTQANGRLEFKRHNVSQLVAIDISDLKNPKVIKKTDIIGQLREGVSRKIEDTIYVVSYIPQYYYWGWDYSRDEQQQEQAWVYSFNVADPKQPQLMQKLQIFEGGSYNVSGGSGGGSSSFNRYFSGVTIAATSNALMVVENWQVWGSVNGSRYNCGSYTSLQQAKVSIIDISDPSGAIRKHTSFETYGHLDDQFKQTYFFDEQTKKGTYIGIFQRQEWNSTDCRGNSVVKNTIESWDITDGENPVRLDSVNFGKENETVRGSTFDFERRIAFAITARNIDPLYAISYADPAKLAIRSQIDGLSGDMNVFRMIGDGKFLIGIGRDTSDVCSGFGDPTTNWRSTNVAVSLIDVRDLDKIRLVQRQCVAVDSAGWVGSDLNWNRDQAHKMIGMHSDGRANVITVPVYYYKRNEDNNGWWWGRYETAVGMMTWDLSRYDDTKDHLHQDVLQNFGTLIHPKGQVQRSIVFTHEGATPRRKVLNLSDTHLSLFDVEDLKNPSLDATVEVARYHQQLFRFGDYLVEHLGQQNYYSYYDSNQNQDGSEFRVKAAGGDLDSQPALASFTVGGVQRVMKVGNNLVLFRQTYDQTNNTAAYWERFKTELLVYDLSNPKAPRRAGSAAIVGSLLPYYYYYCGDMGYGGYYGFGNGSNWTALKDGLVFLSNNRNYTDNTWTRGLIHVDISKADAPTVREYALANTGTWYFSGLVSDGADDSGVYLNYRVQIGESKDPTGNYTVYRYRDYTQRWSLESGVLKPNSPINIPGRLVRTYANASNQRMFLTTDSVVDQLWLDNSSYPSYRYNFRLNLLAEFSQFGKPVASLKDSRVFTSFQLRDMVLNGQQLVLNARRDWYYLRDRTASVDDMSDHLMIFDLGADTLKQTYAGATGTSWVQLMGTYKGRLFVNLPGDGVLVVNMSDPSKPFGQKFLRTLGWASHIEFAQDTLYVAAGYFGVFQLGLSDGVSISTY